MSLREHRIHIDGQEVRRSYSICAEPRPGEIRVAIKQDIGGVFSTWANSSLKAGDTLDVMNPQGAFISKLGLTSMNDPERLAAEEVAKNASVHLVAFAAGSGLRAGCTGFASATAGKNILNIVPLP